MSDTDGDGGTVLWAKAETAGSSSASAAKARRARRQAPARDGLGRGEALGTVRVDVSSRSDARALTANPPNRCVDDPGGGGGGAKAEGCALSVAVDIVISPFAVDQALRYARRSQRSRVAADHSIGNSYAGDKPQLCPKPCDKRLPGVRRFWPCVWPILITGPGPPACVLKVEHESCQFLDVRRKSSHGKGFAVTHRLPRGSSDDAICDNRARTGSEDYEANGLKRLALAGFSGALSQSATVCRRLRRNEDDKRLRHLTGRIR